MRRARRVWMILAGAAVLTTVQSFPTPSQASTYSPGTATPHKPTYNAVTGDWDYHCSYANWARGPVTWHCDLDDRYLFFGIVYSPVAHHSGSFTPPPNSHTTATYHYPMTLGEDQLCTVAWALSVDGGTVQTVACN
jgi:hypothetical protein